MAKERKKLTLEAITSIKKNAPVQEIKEEDDSTKAKTQRFREVCKECAISIGLERGDRE